MMIRNRFGATVVAACVLALSAIAQNAVAASGAYGGSAVAPTIYTKNNWVYSQFSIAGSIPSTAIVNTVYYSWSYASSPAGLLVYLCNNTGSKCRDVTSAGSGSVNFTSDALPANLPLRLYGRVNGTGTMSPLYGNSSSVTVNYTY